ncbi:hypothetical protein B0919_12950 [Hymenobacter sp. CRA2]|nr:hypothetical protein B0919_12950 [Hymenobacter sp. CRA2]
MNGLENLLEGISLLLETSETVGRRSSVLGLLSFLSLPGTVPWCIIELVRLSDAGYSGSFMALLGLGALVVGIGIALLLFWLRLVHSYRPTGFFMVVAALAVLLTASTSYALNRRAVEPHASAGEVHVTAARCHVTAAKPLLARV